MARTMGQPRPDETSSSPQSTRIINVSRILDQLNDTQYPHDDSRGYLQIAGVRIIDTIGDFYLIELDETWKINHYPGKKLFTSHDGKYKFIQLGTERLTLWII